MSRVYRNQASGLVVVSGKIKSISEDRMVMTVTSEEYSRSIGKSEPVELNVSSSTPYEEEIRVGYSVTVSGYPRGKGVIHAEIAEIGNHTFETQDLAVVSGLVKFARMNEEKNADGTPKMKQDGVTPKKPHYDVTITSKDGDKYVDHVIRVYDGNREEGKPSQTDRIAKAFSRFDRETNRIRATFVTQPGQPYSYTSTGKDGKEYVNCVSTHMGYKSMDLEFIDQRERGKDAPAKKQEDKEAPQNAAPVNTGSGFEAQAADLEAEEEMFK